MKSNKVLIGLFIGAFALIGNTVKAQFVELGPDNVGGRVTSLAIDRQDADNITVYAGAATGGLFVRSTNQSLLEKLYANMTDRERAAALADDHEIWHRVRFNAQNGLEFNLPVSALTLLPDGTLVIGTGDDTYGWGSVYSKMSSKGRGIYRFHIDKYSDGAVLLPYTNPENSSLFDAVRDMQCYTKGNTTYLFAATASGLFRWTINDEGSWSSTPKRLSSEPVDQIVTVSSLGIAYFVSGNQLYRISNMAADDNSVVVNNISSTNSAFGGTNKAIKIAVPSANPSYLYAMVIDANGLMENVYFTTNAQTWKDIATPSVVPITYGLNDGTKCGAIYVDPTNARRVIIAGTSVWVGEGFEDGGKFMWTRSSYSENELNGGDYMSNVYNSAIFVHSGIHQITSVFMEDENVQPYDLYYIATDGGIYTTMSFYYFENLNRGLNNVQVNSVAVSPDGSVISGANSNASPFIETRLAHHGGAAEVSWYEDGSMGNMNHFANVLFRGNGGQVAASQFQRINPTASRTIFVSAANGGMGRSSADYFDYTNSTTWTTGSSFLTSSIKGGPEIGSAYLWESDNDSLFQDSVDVTIDLLGYITRADGTIDSIKGNANMTVQKGDRAIFFNKANADYPFEHEFTAAEAGKKVSSTFRVKSPIVSRMVAVLESSENRRSVMYTWMPNDFHKIYDSITDNNSALDATVKRELREKFMWWVSLFDVSRNSILGTSNLYPRNAIISPDGMNVYLTTYDEEKHTSQLYRVSGFEKINFMLYPTDVRRYMDAASGEAFRLLKNTVFTRRVNYQDESWFSRPISSIAVDPRPGYDRIVLTFEDYDESYDNVAIINNASTDEWEIEGIAINQHLGIPAYCSMIEDSTGNIYVGTEEGVFVYDGSSWRQLEQLRGVPVTSIVQQTKKMDIKRAVNHTGITEYKYLFARTKWPRAIYYGTYGRGIFLDMTYVTDTTNEVSDSVDYTPVDIPTVMGNGQNSISIYPNPVMHDANLAINTVEAGMATLRIYDLNGRLVVNRQLGQVAEGEQVVTVSTEGMAKGMYLVNVIIGGHTAATKMMVR